MSLTAKKAGYGRCSCCGFLSEIGQQKYVYCERCGKRVRDRFKQSIAKATAFLIVAMVLFVPANILPVMTMKEVGEGTPSTIIDGVILLVNEGNPVIAGIVFVASIVVPIVKIIVMIILICAVKYNWRTNIKQKMTLYHLIEFIGRWSMLDVFVATVLTTVVNMGVIARVTVEPGANAFALVVIFTMLSVSSFDTRLLWDIGDENVES